MAVYFVTGKLGSGKTLVSVGKIRDALVEGRRVATNLDIKPEKLIGKKAKKTKLYRLPDKPVEADMFQLGSGNDTYDEEKNGLIVLDECGTWFNSRDWQDKSRKGLIDWLLHARKLGWDIIFIIQDVSMIDKQARKAICEHVVYCRRLDRLGIPVLDSIAKLVRKKGIPKPKVHLAIVKYGDLPHSLTVDRWMYTGTDLYQAYDTKQAFVEEYPHRLYEVLPPYYTHGRYTVPLTGKNLMRMTRIYLRRFSKVVLLGAGLTAGAFAGAYMQEPEKVEVPVSDDAPQAEPVIDEPATNPTPAIATDKQEEPATVAEKFEGWIIQGVAQDNTGKTIFVELTGPDSGKANLQTLRASGYIVRMVDACQVLIMNEDRSQTTRLHTSYCGPDKPPAQPPRMTEAERYQWKLEQVRATERHLK